MGPQTHDVELDDLAGPGSESGALLARNAPGERRRSPNAAVGTVGHFLVATSTGRRVAAAMTVLGLAASQFGFLLISRFVLWTGLYKFPYPVVATWIELCIGHLFLCLFASISRLAAGPLTRNGLEGMIAPSGLVSDGTDARSRGRAGSGSRVMSVVAKVVNLPASLTAQSRPGPSSSSGLLSYAGICGGGMFELKRTIAMTVGPSAIVFLLGVTLSNLSFAFAVLPIYIAARIGLVPLTMAFGRLSAGQTDYSVGMVSAALTASMMLLVASIQQPTVRVTWESVSAGVLSSVFVAGWPIMAVRAGDLLVKQFEEQTGRADDKGQDDGDGEIGGSAVSFSTSRASSMTSPRASADNRVAVGSHAHPLGSRAPRTTNTAVSTPSLVHSTSGTDGRVFWTLLHYVSLMSIVLLTPMLFLSGEVWQIGRNCYFLDVAWFWFLCTMTSLAFACSCLFGLLMVWIGGSTPGGQTRWSSSSVRSAVGANMVCVPVLAVQMMVFGKSVAASSLAVALSLAGCVWFVFAE